MNTQHAALAAEGVYKWYGAVAALRGVSMNINAGQITCLLGDNGAGKSTLIQILSGALRPDKGQLLIDGQRVRFNRPADALARGVSAVYQDLALVPCMPIYRNFCLGREPVTGWGPWRRLDKKRARNEAREQIEDLGIRLHGLDRPVSTLSGGQRQVLAIARAVHGGARVLILDEPTAALGGAQSSLVLEFIEATKSRGVAVLLITHNPREAHPIADSFVILRHGALVGTFGRNDLTYQELSDHMAGLSSTDS